MEVQRFWVSQSVDCVLGNSIMVLHYVLLNRLSNVLRSIEFVEVHHFFW